MGAHKTTTRFDAKLVDRYIKENGLKQKEVMRFLGRPEGTLTNAKSNGRIGIKTLRDLESLFGVPHGTFQLEEDGKPRKRRLDGTTVPRSYLPEARTNFEKKKTDRQKDYEAIWKDMEARGKL